MCAIAGFFALRPFLQASTRLENMIDVQAHRGPDGRGFYLRELTSSYLDAPQLGLASRRLAIVDRAHGTQPVFSEDRKCVAVMNGEIYNYRSLQQLLRAQGHILASEADTEVLVHLYESLGLDGMLSRLRGMFAFALWDEARQTLHLARDPLGEKPLYYTVLSSGLHFASELKGLLVLKDVPRVLDPIAVGQYLISEAIPAPRTPYQHIYKLEPGHVLSARIEGGELKTSIRRYWTPPSPEEVGSSREGLTHRDTPVLLRRLEQQLLASVEAQLMGEVPVGILLSGGLDSSIVAAMMSRIRPGLPSFSIGFQETSFDESGPARQVAQHLGLEHFPHQLEPRHLPMLLHQVMGWLDEPLADGSLIPTTALMQHTRSQGVIVALSGDGGDESLGGYPTYLASRLLGNMSPLPDRLRLFLQTFVSKLPSSHENLSFDFKVRRILEGLSVPPDQRHATWMSGWAPHLLRQYLLPPFQQQEAEQVWLEPSLRLWPELVRHGWPEASQLHDLLRYLPDDLLVKTDRSSMSVGMEVRAPLLDPELVAFGLCLPPWLKIRGLRTKVALRMLGKKYLPKTILERPKKGFGMPTAHWLRQMPEGELLEWLTPPRDQPPLVEKTVIEGWVKAHRAGSADLRKTLWPLVIFEHWRKGPWGPGG